MNKLHEPVLLNEVLTLLALTPGKRICDFTIGYGGHAKAIWNQIQPTGTLIGFDQDQTAIKHCQALFESQPNVSLFQANFAQAKQVFNQNKLDGVDGALADLGVSSVQLNDPDRGFSYHATGPLDMRMDQSLPVDATTYLRTTPLKELIRICKAYGQIKQPTAIKALQQYVLTNPNPSTTGAAAVIKKHTPVATQHIKHPARLYFQAIRIALNQELSALKTLLTTVPSFLKPQAVFVVITFHSLEASIVKKHFRDLATAPHLLGVPATLTAAFTNLTPKPLVPSATEIARNPRARSAQLFALQKV